MFTKNHRKKINSDKVFDLATGLTRHSLIRSKYSVYPRAWYGSRLTAAEEVGTSSLWEFDENPLDGASMKVLLLNQWSCNPNFLRWAVRQWRERSPAARHVAANGTTNRSDSVLSLICSFCKSICLLQSQVIKLCSWWPRGHGWSHPLAQNR